MARQSINTSKGGLNITEAQNLRMYNRQQWIDSFEGQLSILRPHLTPRVLDTLSNAAWREHGMNDADPVKAAKALSLLLDKANNRPRPT